MARRLRETPSQTAGPYVHIGMLPHVAGVTRPDPLIGAATAGPDETGQRVNVTGHIYDGAGDLVKDALIEIWQPGLTPGLARAATDFDDGVWQCEMILRQDRVSVLHLLILARGINLGLHTRLYLPTPALADDPVLQDLQPDQRATLIAQQAEAAGYHHDIYLQGPKETVFFDV